MLTTTERATAMRLQAALDELDAIGRARDDAAWRARCLQTKARCRELADTDPDNPALWEVPVCPPARRNARPVRPHRRT